MYSTSTSEIDKQLQQFEEKKPVKKINKAMLAYLQRSKEHGSISFYFILCFKLIFFSYTYIHTYTYMYTCVIELVILIVV